MLMIRKMSPKERNRRITLRSVVTRESSCPDCQRSWNAIGRRCRCSYRSLRISYSMPSATPDWLHRRTKIRTASMTPSSSARAPSSRRPAPWWWRTGPSTTRWTTRGTRIPAPVAAAAATSIQIMCATCGRTYDRMRQRLDREDRRALLSGGTQ
jgi:hypothetical protein